jgi:hypothetical protein
MILKVIKIKMIIKILKNYIINFYHREIKKIQIQ